MTQSRHVSVEERKRNVDATLTVLQQHGVLHPGEIDRADFLDVVDLADMEEGGLYELSGKIGDYQIEHGVRYENLAIFPDQAELSDEDVIAMAGAFARLAGLSGDMVEFRLEMLDGTGEQGGERARLSYRLDEEPGHLDFVRYRKRAPGSLKWTLAEMLDGKDEARFAVGYFDDCLLLTRLTDAQLVALNRDLDPASDTFVRLS